MKSKTIKLQDPIEVQKDGSKIKVTEVTIRPLKAKDLKLIPKDSYLKENKYITRPEEGFPLLSSVTGLSIEDIEELSLDDLSVLDEELTNFLEKSQKDGSGKSPSGR